MAITVVSVSQQGGAELKKRGSSPSNIPEYVSLIRRNHNKTSRQKPKKPKLVTASAFLMRSGKCDYAFSLRSLASLMTSSATFLGQGW